MSQQALSREVQEIWELFRRTSNQIEELARSQEETDREIKEMAKEVKLVNETVNALTGKWGRFVEGLVAPGAVRIFRERGIEVKQSYTRAESQKHGDTMEIDVLVVNDEYVIAISVKSTLKIEDVDAHIDDLSRFREFFTNFAGKKLLGAVAGVVIDEGADRYAYRKGLFVITQAGENIKILNDEKFKPKEW
jgi:hypothetical protein